MPVNDQLGIRMKEYYEQIPKTKLMRRTPVIIRVDGRAFHSFTKGMDRPFDIILRNAMNKTMQYLCENVQGAVLGYCQSDEITLVLVDYKKLTSDAWFDYEVQKVCSISAAMATMAFNNAYFDEVVNTFGVLDTEVEPEDPKEKERLERYKVYTSKVGTAMFDSRCFNIPREEVTNLVYWRQLDATRNSIQLAGQAYFSHKQLMHRTCNQIQDMLFKEKGINWNDYPGVFKRGACCVRVAEEGDTRPHWEIDLNIPIFKGEGREYIEKLILPEEQ